MACCHEAFHHASFLVYLHRVDTSMTRTIVVFGDGIAKSLMQLLDLGIKDLRETEQEWRRNPALQKSLDQRIYFNPHQGISRGMDCKATLLTNSKISPAPVVDSVNAVWDFAWRQAEALG
jgi:hypothetical protein